METRALMHEFSRAKSTAAMSKQLLNQYSLRNDARGVSIGVMAKVLANFNKVALESQGIKVTSQVADIVAMRVPLDKLAVLETRSDIVSYTVAHPVAPDCDRMRADTRTDSVQAGLGVPQAYKGDGVLIGITDWGFDYCHPNINSNAERRIYKAWDHYKLSGPAPTGFDYGTVYSTYEELVAAGGDTSGLYGYGTHGTHVAGICGGRGTKPAGNANSLYIGQAPEAQFLLGSWLLDEAAWMDQVAWMYREAKAAGKRLVINSSWGMYTFSTLDGTSLLSQAINHYSDSGVVFVTSAGNNGDTYYHLQRTFGNNDTLKSIATYYSGGVGQALIYWGEVGQNFQAGFAIADRDHNIYPGAMFSTASNTDYFESYIVVGNNDTIHYNVMTEAANPFDQRPHVLLNVEKKGTYALEMLCLADSGNTVNIWNVCNLQNHAGNIGCDFTNGGVYGCQYGNKDYGVGEPGCAEKTITVAAHAAGRWKNDSTYVPGVLAGFSSHGPTLDGRHKPEISAPGVAVISSISSRCPDQYEAVAVVTALGHSYKYAAMSGTSMSGPSVTGVVALMLQANPNLSVNQVRDIIFTTAHNDVETGPLAAQDSISPLWGYGKINAVKAVNEAYDKLSIEQAVQNTPEVVVYPNPAARQFTVLTGTNLPCRIVVYTVDGRFVTETTAVTEATLNVSHWNNGIYIVRVQNRVGMRTTKLIVNN